MSLFDHPNNFVDQRRSSTSRPIPISQVLDSQRPHNHSHQLGSHRQIFDPSYTPTKHHQGPRVSYLSPTGTFAADNEGPENRHPHGGSVYYSPRPKLSPISTRMEHNHPPLSPRPNSTNKGFPLNPVSNDGIHGGTSRPSLRRHFSQPHPTSGSPLSPIQHNHLHHLKHDHPHNHSRSNNLSPSQEHQGHHNHNHTHAHSPSSSSPSTDLHPLAHPANHVSIHNHPLQRTLSGNIPTSMNPAHIAPPPMNGHPMSMPTMPLPGGLPRGMNMGIGMPHGGNVMLPPHDSMAGMAAQAAAINAGESGNSFVPVQPHDYTTFTYASASNLQHQPLASPHYVGGGGVGYPNAMPLCRSTEILPMPGQYGCPKFPTYAKPDYRRFCYSVGRADVPYAATGHVAPPLGMGAPVA